MTANKQPKPSTKEVLFSLKLAVEFITIAIEKDSITPNQTWSLLNILNNQLYASLTR